MVEEEEHHSAASKALEDLPDGFTSTHTVAETFATLTGGRLGLQLSPHDAIEVLDANVIGRLRLVELTLRDYRRAMKDSQAVGARGGAIFDLLHLQSARREGATRILTINVRHFQIFAPDLREIISLP